MTNTQNPAPAATNPVSVGRVRSGSPAPDVVKERGDEPSKNVPVTPVQPQTMVEKVAGEFAVAVHAIKAGGFIRSRTPRFWAEVGGRPLRSAHGRLRTFASEESARAAAIGVARTAEQLAALENPE